MIQETFKLETRFMGVVVISTLMMLSLEEESSYIDRLIKVGEEKDQEKEYAFLVDSLASWSTEPLKVLNSDGSEVEFEDKTASGSVKEYFGTYSRSKERLLNSILSDYRKALIPTTRFL